MNLYIIAPSASQDLNVEAGEKLLIKFSQKCQQLAQFPNWGRSYSHIRPSLRGLPLDGYIIFSWVIDDTVEILRIVKYLSKINYTYLNTSCLLQECLLPIFTRKLILHDYLAVVKT